MAPVVARWVRWHAAVLARVVQLATAAGLAWQVAEWTSPSSAISAAASAVFTVQANTVSSLRSGFRRVLGTGLGGGAGLVVVASLRHWDLPVAVQVAGIMALAVGLAAAARLSAATQLQAGFSAIVVVTAPTSSPGLGALAVGATVIGTILGVGVGAVGLVPVPTVALAGVSGTLARQMSAVLDSVAVHASRGPFLDVPSDALPLARTLEPLTDAVASASDAVVEAARWHPLRLAGRTRVDAAVTAATEAALAVRHASMQTRGLVRALSDASASGSVPVLASLPAALRAAGAAAGLVADLMGVASGGTPEASGDLLDDLGGAARRAAGLVRTCLREASDFYASDTSRGEGATVADPMLVYGSVLADLSRIADELDPEDGPHAGGLRSLE